MRHFLITFSCSCLIMALPISTANAQGGRGIGRDGQIVLEVLDALFNPPPPPQWPEVGAAAPLDVWNPNSSGSNMAGPGGQQWIIANPPNYYPPSNYYPPQSPQGWIQTNPQPQIVNRPPVVSARPVVTYNNQPITLRVPRGESEIVTYSINNRTYTMSPGFRQQFEYSRAWQISFDRGDGVNRSHSLRDGEYVFMKNRDGLWVLYQALN
jgi:hypothetical protein